jgi:molecular chaperone DnaK (HSP70)
LVLAFDVGTTYSAISYCILDPGEVPKIEPVTRSVFVIQHTCFIAYSTNIRYPAQEHSGGNSKIPSILYYDSNGTVRAIGAEARQEHIIERAEEEGWMKLEWFVFRILHFVFTRPTTPKI